MALFRNFVLSGTLEVLWVGLHGVVEEQNIAEKGKPLSLGFSKAKIEMQNFSS